MDVTPLRRLHEARARHCECLARVTLCALGLLALTGCSSFNKKVDNPVIGPRPPRISDADIDPAGDANAAAGAERLGIDELPDGDIQTVSATQVVIRDEDIAARVNGRPIFVSEVLERYRGQLAQAQAQLPPHQYQQLRRAYIEEDLDGHIEQALALSALHSQLKKEQRDQLDERLDEFFYEKEIPDLQKKLGAESLAEVEAMMQQAGTTLATYRRVWGDRTLAAQWVSEQLPSVAVSRQELLAEYQSRIEEYREPAQVRWQQCWIASVKNGGREGARTKLQQAVADLKAGKSFADVVASYSDGPQVSSDGIWDWTQVDSIADAKLRETLLQIEINQIGPILDDEQGFRLVKLLGRKDERIRPFEEVQDELRESITQTRRAAAAQKMIDDLRTKAHIETIFDGEPAEGAEEAR
jgi:peptidyl-prolyl cis-trans isomerase SurA